MKIVRASISRALIIIVGFMVGFIFIFRWAWSHPVIVIPAREEVSMNRGVYPTPIATLPQNRIQVVESFKARNIHNGPDITVLKDTLTGYEFLLVQQYQAVAVTTIPKDSR